VLVHAAVLGWKPPASLRFIAVGGAAGLPELLAQAARLGLPVYEGYGLSECGSVSVSTTPASNRPAAWAGRCPTCRSGLDAEVRSWFAVPGCWVTWATRRAILRTRSPTGDLGSIDADGFVQVRAA